MTKFRYTLIAGLAAVGLALAGCGGGGGSSSNQTPPTTTPPEPPPAVQPHGAVRGCPGRATTDAEDAVAAAEQAEADAVKYAKMLTTTEVGGASKTAMMSAQAILDAMDAAAQAVTDAEAALAAAKDAETDAMDVAADHPQKAALDAAITAAIEAAEDAIDDAEAVRDGTKLRNAVAEVVGTNKKGTPRSVATTVGKDISDALKPPAPGGTAPENRNADRGS